MNQSVFWYFSLCWKQEGNPGEAYFLFLKTWPNTAKRQICSPLLCLMPKSLICPPALKFVSNKLIVDGSFEFNNIDEAQEMEFAKKLFEFSYVKSIYISKNFVSITKYDLKNWDEVTLELRNFIKNYLEINEINFKRKEVETEKIDLDETSKKIISILDEYIKPAVSSDGGNILFDSYDKDKKLVKVILQGACSGCPSSTVTLKNGIENMLKEMLSDKVNSVEAING